MPGSASGPDRGAGRQHQVIDVGPGRDEHARRQRATVLHRSLAALQAVDLLETRRVELHAHELRHRIERRADAPVTEIERVVDAAERRHVDVHPLHRLVRRVVDRVRAAHPRGRAGRSLQRRRPPVDRELRFAVEDDEHLLAVVVEVLPDAGFRLDDAAMEEPQVGVERVAAEHGEEGQLPRPAVHARGRPIARGIVVRDPLRERQTRRVGRGIGRRGSSPALLRDDGRSRRTSPTESKKRAMATGVFISRSF